MSEKSKSEINMDKISEMFSDATGKAEKIVEDKEKTQEVLNKATEKAHKVKGALEKVWESLTLMFGLVSSWVKGDYRDVPVGSIIAIIAALIYLICPIDVIPDFIPGIGFIDDVFVIGLVVAQVAKDLEKYKIWKNEK
jgi:uncharacterized membrane protein YkvA (DUF1232 family)